MQCESEYGTTYHLAQLRSPQLTPPIRLLIRKPTWTDDGEPQRLSCVQVQVGEPFVFHVCDDRHEGFR
jgi:hypothetical protein